MSDFNELLASSQKNPGSAFAVLFERYRHVVDAQWRKLSVWAGPEISESDFCQETWIRVWSRIGEFRGHENSAESEKMFQAWLRITAHRVAVNQLVRRRSKKRLPQVRLVSLNGDGSQAIDCPGIGGTASEQLMRDENQQRLDSAICQLADPLSIRIVRERFFEGRSLREIATRSGLTYEQARYRFNQALDRLKHQLWPE